MSKYTYEEQTHPVREEYAVQHWNEEQGGWFRLLINGTYGTLAEAQQELDKRLASYAGHIQVVGGIGIQFEASEPPKFRIARRYVSKFEEVVS